MATDSFEGVCNGPRKLYKSDLFSDLTIICGSNPSPVHQAVICPRSDYFAAALRFPGKEAEEGKIDLSVEDPEMVERMIYYFYHLDYLPTSYNRRPNQSGKKNDRMDNAPGNCPCISTFGEYTVFRGKASHNYCTNPGLRGVLEIHAQMYAMADKYQISEMKDLAKAKFEAAMRFHGGYKLLPHVVPIVFTTTPDSDAQLRNLVARAIALDNLLRLKSFRGAVEKIDGLSLAVLKAEHPDHFDEAAITKSKKRGSRESSQRPSVCCSRTLFGNQNSDEESTDEDIPGSIWRKERRVPKIA